MKKIILFLVIGLVSGSLYAQDPHFSQFYHSPLTLNPAITGLFNADVRVSANYRNQWASITTPYETIAASADANLFKDQLRGDYVGAGLQLMTDKAGDANFRSTSAVLSLSYNKALSEYENHYLSGGLQVGAVQRDVDFNKLFFDSQFDGNILNPNIGSGENIQRNQFTYFDISAGLHWYFVPDDRTSFYLGASMFHINQPNQSFYGDDRELLYQKVVLHGGAEFGITDNVSLIPRLIYMTQGPSSELNLGASVKFTLGYLDDANPIAFSVGTLHRMNDAQLITTKLDYGPATFGLSYDFNISSLTRASRAQGGPEIALIYRIGQRAGSRGGLKCPSF